MMCVLALSAALCELQAWWGMAPAEQPDFAISETKSAEDALSPCVRLFIELLLDELGWIPEHGRELFFNRPRDPQ